MFDTLVLPTLQEGYSLSSSQIESFRNNGHLLLHSVATEEEIRMYRHVINKAAYPFNTEHRRLDERDTYGKAFLQINNLW